MESGRYPDFVRTTYLQMFGRPSASPRPLPADAAVIQAHQPTVSFYRYLYNTIGEKWQWWNRRQLTDEELVAIIHHPHVEVQVLYAYGVPAGYAELDRRDFPDIELAYFGLMGEFVGRGYGLPFLQWTIHKAWDYRPQRLWVHTCNLDHPNALNVYQKAGFEIYDTTQEPT
ncbi:MAG: hypothetical protein KDE51_07780 [Anaerolineales bacterium]|nr:hypothetical protein [Anaerolineales bacterium]